MAGKKVKKTKELTVKTALPQKKKRGKEKKPTLSIGFSETSGEKPSAKPIALKKPKKEKAAKTEKELNSKPQSSVKPQPETPQPPKKIVVTFVCTGNTCRSAMAQYLFKSYLKTRGREDDFDVRSAGIMANVGDDMSEYAYAALKELNVNVAVHYAQLLCVEDVKESDIVVCMTESHLRAIGGLPNVVTISSLTGGGDIADPFGGSLEDYRYTARQLLNACPKIYEAACKTANERRF